MFLFLIPLVVLIAVIIGLFVLVKKDTNKMNDEINMPVENKINIQSQNDEKKSPAFHLFLYLLSFLSLGFLITGIISVYFQFINKIVTEDATDAIIYSGHFDQDSLRFGISALIISFLVYYIILYFLNRKLVNEEIKQDSIIRKFITYLALFVFSAMSIGSLVTLLYNFLNGELSSKSLLKIIVFFLVSLFYLAFYLWEIRRKEFSQNIYLSLYFVSMAVSFSAIIIGFSIVDSPRVTKEKKIDREIINSMNSMQYDIEDFYKDDNRLPESEKEVKFRKNIQYKKTGNTTYELCSVFLQPAEKEDDYYSENWSHPAGKYCFKKDVTKEDEGNDFPVPSNNL